MKKSISYTDEPLGDLRVIDDFLPPPSELAFKEESVLRVAYAYEQATPWHCQHPTVDGA